MTHDNNAHMEGEQLRLAVQVQYLMLDYWNAALNNERLRARRDDEAWAFSLERMRRQRAEWAEADAWRAKVEQLKAEAPARAPASTPLAESEARQP
jgi:hypothetical protein